MTQLNRKKLDQGVQYMQSTLSLDSNLLEFLTINIRHAFSGVLSNPLFGRMRSHTYCICVAFHHCAYLNVSLKSLPEKMHSRIGCICLTFLHCAFSSVSSNFLPLRMQRIWVCWSGAGPPSLTEKIAI